MTVRATTRREQIRRPNGDRVILPGAQDATGLSALAAVSAGADTISPAARHATQGDVIEPAAEAVILFESLRGTDAALTEFSLPPGVTRTYGNVNTGLGDRRDNAGWSVARCDVDRCDDVQTQAGTAGTAPTAELNATDAPAIYTFTTALARALANAEADPALTAWALSTAPLRVNMFPSPSVEDGTIPAVWQAPSGATISNQAAGGFAGSRHLRLTATGASASLFSRPFGYVAPGASVTAQFRVKGTAGVSGFAYLNADGAAASTPVTLTASWQLVTVTYTRSASAPGLRLELGVSFSTAAGNLIDLDAVFVEDGATAGPYADPAAGVLQIFPNPSFEVDTATWAGSGTTLTRQSTFAKAGAWSARCVTTSANVANGDLRYGTGAAAMPAGFLAGRTYTFSAWIYTPAAHTTFSTASNSRQRRILLFVSTNGSTFTEQFGPQGPNVVGWSRLTFTYTFPPGTTGALISVGVAGSPTDVSFTTYVDAVQAWEGGPSPYTDAAAWARGTETSPTLLTATPAAAGAYSRPVDATAPQLDLTGSKWVHRRTGLLSAGDRLSSPWGPCSYGIVPGRTFTVAAWLAVTPTVGALPSFRWVAELALDPGSSGQALIVATSAPFSPADVYARYSSTLTPTIPGLLFGVAVHAVRVHLEVVNPGSLGAGAEVSVRGAHLYAGPDRGDDAGLDAVVLPVPLVWLVNVDADEGFKATRVDVHGNDQVSHVTGASGSVTYQGGAGQQIAGGSAGRLTMRVPDPAAAGLLDYVYVNAEEVNGGPAAQVSLQTIRVWHEVDATPDIVSLTVDRSTDADPSDSTVPIGNYAASTIDLQLDDVTGEWSLFGRRYIDLGHRIEAAVGMTYTNRCDDPLGIDADEAGTTTLTWPTSPVVPVTQDRYGQVPPAPFAGHATAELIYDDAMRVTSPAGEGWSMRGHVWVRYTGDEPPTLYAAAVRRYVRPGVGISVSVDPATIVPLVGPTVPDVWTLVKVPAVSIALGSNAVAVSGGFEISDPDRWIEYAAPDFERVDPTTGDVVEVVETAPAGVFSSSSWDGGTGGAVVQVSGLDVLATSGAADLDGELHTATTVEAELRYIARRYLDLGADQVVIVDQGTPVAYAIPATKVSTQIADLAKVATLTAFTDGAGRFTALLRSEVDPSLAARYLGDRNLIEAESAIAPDAVRNDVKVTAHPVARSNGVPLGSAGNSSPTDTAAAGWALSGQEVYLPPGDVSLEVIIGWSFDAALSGVVVNPVGWFDWQVGQANPFNVFSVEGDGTTTIPYPPGSNWGTTLGGFQSWATATVEVFPTFGRVVLTNREIDPGPGPFVPPIYQPGVWVDHVEVIGDGVTVTSIAQRFVRASSVEDFGAQPVAVDVRLAQSSALLPAVGLDVLDNFSLRDSSGERWLPDLEATVLADPWREIGDRVLIADTDSSISGEYRILTHTLAVGVGAESSLYLRRVATGADFAVADVSLADDGKVTSY